MRKIIFTITLLYVCSILDAQITYDYLKAADTYYKKGDFYSAAQYYEKYLAVSKTKIQPVVYDPYAVEALSKQQKVAVSNKQTAIYRLGESYRKLNYYVKAEPYYQQATAFSQQDFPLARYWHAETLRALGRYAEAETEFTAFIQGYGTADKYSSDAKRGVSNLQFIQAQLKRSDLNLFTVNKAADILNPHGANYAPVWIAKDTLLFTSTRTDSVNKTKVDVHINKVYKAGYKDSTVTSVTRVDLPQLAGVHQGVLSVTPDGAMMYLTRWTITPDGKKISSLYISKKTKGIWSDPVALDSTVNYPGHNTQQPLVMPDGRTLLFSSDRPGGMGGFDIWYATIGKSGSLTGITNLGSVINTSSDEQAPYYHKASGTLIFSTNGRVGMGGFDFFKSKGTIGNWSEPQNLGYPVNSIKDDIYFSSKGDAKNLLTDILVSSDRFSECCLDLVNIHKKKLWKQISGTVVSCDDNAPLAGATVSIVDTINNKILFSKVTGADGSYSFTIEDYQPLRAIAGSEGYDSSAISIGVPSDEDQITLKNPAICLNKPKPPVPTDSLGNPLVKTLIVLDNVYFDFDKSDIRKESYYVLDSVVSFMKSHPNAAVEVSAYTDSKGTDEYNLRLSERRAKVCVDYIISKGIEKSRLTSKGYGEALPAAPNTLENGDDNPEGRQKNRRTEFRILHF